MDVRKAFEEGRFLEIADSGEVITAPEERLLLGISLFKVGREIEAEDVFEELSRELVIQAKALYYLALLSRKRGDHDTAQHYLTQYRAFYPDDDEAVDLLESQGEEESFLSAPSIELAREYARQGHYELARDIYVRILESSGGDSLIEKEGRHAEAMFLIKTLQGWIERVNT
ncbi:MAG: tetratricopeptide repeat protein [Desulfomonilia bacterium]